MTDHRSPDFAASIISAIPSTPVAQPKPVETVMIDTTDKGAKKKESVKARSYLLDFAFAP